MRDPDCFEASLIKGIISAQCIVGLNDIHPPLNTHSGFPGHLCNVSETVLRPVVGKQEHHSQNFVYVTEFQFGMISFLVIGNFPSSF